MRYELETREASNHSWREALSAINPVELWHAFQEAEDAVCLMAPHTSQFERRDDA